MLLYTINNFPLLQKTLDVLDPLFIYKNMIYVYANARNQSYI